MATLVTLQRHLGLPSRVSTAGAAAAHAAPHSGTALLAPVAGRLTGLARSLTNVAAARLSGGARTLSKDEVLCRYNSIQLNRGERWVDIGSGDSHTLGEIGKRNPKGEVVGFDFDGAPVLETELARRGPNLTRLPDNTRYVVMYPGRILQSSTPYPGPTERVVLKDSEDLKESMSERARRLIVERSGGAQVVSVFFPFVHKVNNSSFFYHPDGTITYMTVAEKLMKLKGIVTLESRSLMASTETELETAIDVLASGGSGVIMTESVTARDLIIKWLAKNSRVQNVVYHDGEISKEGMRSVGIREHVIPNGKGEDVVLGEGYMILFTKK